LLRRSRHKALNLFDSKPGLLQRGPGFGLYVAALFICKEATS
jgi:hypothetical protein